MLWLTTRFRTWWASIPPDGRIAVVMVVLLLPVMVVSSEDPPPEGEVSRGLDVVSWGLLAGAGAGLLLRKRFPATVVMVIMGCVSLWYGLGHTSGLINPLALVAFYQLGYTGDRRRELGVGLPAILMPLVLSTVFAEEPVVDYIRSGDWPIDALLWPLLAVLMGELVRNRSLLLDEYAQRATAAEADRDAEADRRVARERLRIARDLHDVLAHTVSLMNVQAGVAADTLDRDPDTARASLADIRTAGREAMSEVRATIAVLRDDGADPDTSPAPGLDRIPELVEGARSRGLAVDLVSEVPEEPRSDSLVELTAYRIVQEGLTNVIRHAQASHVQVTVRQQAATLVVEVTDDGAPDPAAEPLPPGFGLRGMQERVEPLGGTLSYGPRPHGGWTVVGTLPLRKASG